MLYIIGCGRSGTKYTTELLNSQGVAVLHEDTGPEGEVGWKALLKILDGDINPSGHTVLHQVRNPLEAISSMRTHSDALLSTVSRHYTSRVKPHEASKKLYRCMEYWYEWNILADRYAQFTFKVEELSQAIHNIFALIGRGRIAGPLPDINPRLNTRRTRRFAKFQTEPVTWQQLRSIDLDLTQKIQKLARGYGYCDEYLSDEFLVASVNLDGEDSTSRSVASKIFISTYLLKMPQVRSITSDICDNVEFWPATPENDGEDAWTLAWGYPLTGRRFAVAETGFFWDAMHIDTQGLYQFSSLNTAEAGRELMEFLPPWPAKDLIEQASIPKSKYRQPSDGIDWYGVVFACQNPSDRSILSVGSSNGWWQFLLKCCRFYGNKLFIKLHPWNSNEIEGRIRETAKPYGCFVGRAGHKILDHCDHVVLYNSTFAADCFLRGVPVKQGAPGYFSSTGAVTYCGGDPTLPITDSRERAEKLLDFLVWRYCFSMDCSLEKWKDLLRLFESSRKMFPLPTEDSYGSYLKHRLPNGLGTRLPIKPNSATPICVSTQAIPKLFHILWLSESSIPMEHTSWLKEWRELHTGWDTHVWGSEVVDELPLCLQEQFSQTSSLEAKCNIARVALVHKYGGVYRGTSYRPLRSIEPVLQGCKAFAVVERANGRLTNDFFGAIAGHSFTADILSEVQGRFDPIRPRKIGSQLFNDIYRRGREDVRLFERDAFAPDVLSAQRFKGPEEFPGSFALKV